MKSIVFYYILILTNIYAVTGLQYYKPLFCNNKWQPESNDEQKSYNNYIKNIKARKIPGFNYKKTKKTFIPPKKENVNINNIFNQEGEVSITD